MTDTLLYIIFMIACLCCFGAGMALGQAQGFATGFAACSDIWNSDDEDVLDAEEVE